MNPNNYTIKAQELIQAAQQFAFDDNDVNIETNHLLKALLNDKDSAVEFLLKKNDINIPYVEGKVNESLNRLPKSSSGAPAQQVSRDLNNVLLRANKDLKQFGDEFINLCLHLRVDPVFRCLFGRSSVSCAIWRRFGFCCAHNEYVFYFLFWNCRL